MAKAPHLTKEMTIGQVLRLTATRFPLRVALVYGGERVAYWQLMGRVRALARALHRLGIGKGDRIATLLWSEAAFVYVFFAAAELGAVIAPLPPRLRREQMESFLRELQPALVVASAELEAPDGLEALRALQREMPTLKHILLTDTPVKQGLDFRRMLNGPPLPDSAHPALSPDDLLTILYTSGTTGRAKGVMHSHRGLISPIVASIALREMWARLLPTPRRLRRWLRALFRYRLRLIRAAGRQQVFLSVMGMHTISGLECMLQALLMGDRLVLLPRFHPGRTLETIERERVTILVGAPVSYMAMLRVSDFERYRLSSLLICATGSAPCPPELAREIQRRFRCAVHIGFGMTELGGGVAATSLDDAPDRQAETVGRPMPGMEVRIVDEQGRPLPPGEVGELVCRSDSLMLGYFGSSDNPGVMIDGERWLYTGDLAMMDEKGYLRIVGRKKDLIIRGGQNVYPAKIERHLMAMTGVREAAVIGVPDALGSETIWAFVIPEDGTPLNPLDVVAHCRAALEAHEIPEQVRIVPDFPRTSTGKPQKHILREMALKEQKSDGAKEQP